MAVLFHPEEGDGSVVDEDFGFEGVGELFADAELGGVGVGEVFPFAPVAAPEGLEKEQPGAAAGDPERAAEDPEDQPRACALGAAEGVGPGNEAVDGGGEVSVG